MPELAWILAGLVVAGLAAAVAWTVAGARAAARANAEWTGVVDAERTGRSQAESAKAAAEARCDELATARDEAARERDRERSGRGEAERQLAAAQSALDAERRNVAEQKALLDRAQATLRDVFASVGAEELRKVQQQLIDAAKNEIGHQRKQAEADLEARQKTIDATLAPVRELLEKQGKAVGELELKREAAYATMAAQIEGVLRVTDAVRSEAGKLTSALRRSDVRGRWGEVALRNLVEMAGMTEHVDFETQVHVAGADGAQRPDLVVKLPGGGCVVVDSKVPLEKFLAAQEADADVAALLAEHAAAMKRHVDALSSKAYWSQFPNTPSYVVMFVPIDSALGAALSARIDLQEYALRSRVILASSGIFLGLLQTVQLFWRQEQLAANAKQISDAGAELYERLATFASYLAKVGTALRNAGDSYDKAVGSLESRLLPAARKFEELKAAEKPAMPELPGLALDPKPITKGELLEPVPPSEPAGGSHPA